MSFIINYIHSFLIMCTSPGTLIFFLGNGLGCVCQSGILRSTQFHSTESLLGLVFHPLSWARPGSVLPQVHGSQFSPFNISALFSHQAPSCMASYIYQLSSVGLFLPGKGPSIWHIRASAKATLLSGYSLFTFSWVFRELMYFPMCLKPFSFTQICPFPSTQALKWQLLH